ncbi:MAG: TonB-dependent receptor [Prevotella sp.]|uniref:TonB-dependent receptor n=1 Tax=Prevotella sp. TaxID=59823 RepID=UPI0025859C62|nr:TonB-dependent receptor [Prevotella sp.]MDD6854100.1 TonB-dependent receptor [Prevotella sp.]
MKRFILFFLTILFVNLCYSQTIRTEIKEIGKKYGVFFFYDSSINVDTPVSGRFSKGHTLDQALNAVFNGTEIAWIKVGKNIILKRNPKPRKRQIKKAPKPKLRTVKSEKVYMLTGRITDNDGEPLINATVLDTRSNCWATTNPNGYFSIFLSPGKHHVSFSYVGYKTVSKDIDVTRNITENIVLNESSTLSEIVVKENQNSPLLTSQTGRVRLTSADFNRGFALLSSPDVVKTLQRGSGISSGIELSSGLYVHGGNSDENLFLLDGTPLYQINHLLGLFSSFNTDIIKTVDFYKSGFPAKYNGRLSSITDVRIKDGNLKKIQGIASIGLIDGRFSLEGPIIKDKTSFVFSIRRSWLDVLLRPYFSIANKNDKNGDHRSFNYMFHDLNAKITHHLNDHSKLYVSFYSGMDNYLLKDKDKYDDSFENTEDKFKWGSTNAVIGWDDNKRKRNSSISIVYTHNFSSTDYFDRNYDTDSQTTRLTNFTTQRNHSLIDDLGVKADFDWHLSNLHNLYYGVEYFLHFFNPQTEQEEFYVNDLTNAADTTTQMSHDFCRSRELTTYLGDDMILNNHFSANVGINNNIYFSYAKTYYNIDPRLSVKFAINNNIVIKASCASTTQYIHRIASTALDMPTDYWVPTTSEIKPSRARQWCVGLYLQPSRSITVSAEGFFKQSRHLYEYRHWMGLQPPASRWNKDVADGKGRAFGIDFDGHYRNRKMILDMAYTLSWTYRKFNEIGTRWFRDKFDNRHKINISCSYNCSAHTSLYAAWTFHSGNRMTLPSTYALLPILSGSSSDYDIQKVYTSPNNVSLPAYHRMDIGINFKKETKKGYERIYNVSLYNAYCHFNTMYAKIHENDDGTFSAKTRGYIPIVPSISYTLKF